MDGLNVSVTEYGLSAILIVVLALGVGYEATHRTYPPVAAVPCPAAPAITFSPTIEVHPTVTLPAPDATPDDPAPQPEEQSDPVFEHRTPIITDALRQPMVYAKNQ